MHSSKALWGSAPLAPALGRTRTHTVTALATPTSHWPPVFGEHPQYGDACTLCGGSHFLPCTHEAVEAIQQELEAIHRHQRLDYDSSGPGDPRLHLDYLFTLGPGRMLGVLLAVDAAGQQQVLKAFSGQITECWHIPGWVGPVAGIINESPVYVKTRRVIEGMSARLHQLDQQQAGQRTQQLQPQQQSHQNQQQRQQLSFQQQQRQLLKRRRRCLSHRLLQQIQQSYVTATVGGVRPLSLLDVYMAYRARFSPEIPVTRAGQDFVGMPAGVGDCCAPKLLHAAAQRGLRPVALAEVWCGSAPGTATKAKQGRVESGDADSRRQHCRLYGPCDKCRAVLGTMLCCACVSV